MKKVIFWSAMLLCSIFATQANAQVVVTGKIEASSLPNNTGSNDSARQNYLTAVYNNSVHAGDPSLASYITIEQGNTLQPIEFITTPFKSWKGDPNANGGQGSDLQFQTGSQMYGGFILTAQNGGHITLNNIMVRLTSSDPTRLPSITLDYVNSNFNIGFANGIQDDGTVIYGNGGGNNGSFPVHSVMAVGPFTSFFASNATTNADKISSINAAASSLVGITLQEQVFYSGQVVLTQTFQVIPEPSDLLLCLMMIPFSILIRRFLPRRSFKK